MKEFTSKKELLEYIGQAIEVESNVLSQQNLIKEYDENSEQRKPTLNQEEHIESSIDVSKEKDKASEQGCSSMVAFLVAGMSALISWCLSQFFTVILGWFIAIIAAVVGVEYMRMSRTNKKEADYWTEQKKEQDEADIQRVNAANVQLREQYNHDLALWQAENDEAHSYFAKPLAETQEVLKNLYSADVIYPKYRNLPALTSIYEYLITGRCEELTGPHGAYNLYEDEVRKDMIISQMNQVIQNLEQIKANQYKLYEEVCRIRENTQAAVNELRAIHGYAVELTGLASLTAYYAGIAAANTNVMMYYHRLDL